MCSDQTRLVILCSSVGAEHSRTPRHKGLIQSCVRLLDRERVSRSLDVAVMETDQGALEGMPCTGHLASSRFAGADSKELRRDWNIVTLTPTSHSARNACMPDIYFFSSLFSSLGGGGGILKF